MTRLRLPVSVVVLLLLLTAHTVPLAQQPQTGAEPAVSPDEQQIRKAPRPSVAPSSGHMEPERTDRMAVALPSGSKEPQKPKVDPKGGAPAIGGWPDIPPPPFPLFPPLQGIDYAWRLLAGRP